ncbi:PEP/pyruvate-binding domain-containing protein [Planomonospora parontospora]|uniref:PEP/pyruvate-binding domain-containing protein n=1 Tax=Planomonospora parontospora TaxID=58119 RepID=UPI001670E70B|nr:PEP/pyruvate-binding domain-containing protein [Planomonospora parontospora]GGL32260.1 phosphoenolpyruvate synthase [Planomonospora parontospora subsp. antibiotica]GII16915.1 phosphoenolpyruvate synthase [Planomonospora parontospora subsp. antibiotica]
MEIPLVLRFEEIDAGMLPLVGGKAANLGVLTAAGFPVPAGVCLTTEAYRRVTGRSGALEAVLDALEVTSPTDTRALAELAGTARAAVLSAPVPEEVADAVRRSAHGPVAVRSSATAEDLPDASFAGQQDTFLNVVGPEAVLEAVRHCWASLWTDRAVAYRAANGIAHRSVRLAVVIQEMVQAEVAGVMFTADPVTGRRRQAVIDAAPGLGEAVVSGAVNPDRFTVDIATGRITDRRAGDKRLAVRSLAGGGVERVETPAAGTADERAASGTADERAASGTAGRRTAGGTAGGMNGIATGVARPAAEETPDGAGGAFCLTDGQVRALAELGDRVEGHYGAPQDIEWAVDPGGALWLTQSRPITTLHPIPRHAGPDEAAGASDDLDDGLRIHVCLSLAQGLHQPITPMGMAAFRLMSSAALGLLGHPVADPRAGAPRFAEAGGRLFLDVTGIMRSRVGRALLPRVLDVMEARSAVVLRTLAADPRFGVTRRSVRPALRRVLRVAGRHRVLPRALRALLRPESAHRHARATESALRAHLASPPDATALQRLDRAELILSRWTFRLVPEVAPGPLAGFAMFGLAVRLLGGRARPGELPTVLRGLPRNVTTEMDLALWHLAARIRRDAPAAALLLGTPAAELAARFHAGALPAVVEEGLREFLREYGVRAVAEIDLGVPRWSEDPAHVIGVLANYLRLDDPALAPDVQFARGAVEAEAVVEGLAARAGGLRGRVVRFALGRARALGGLREFPKFLLVTSLAAARAELAAVGGELAGRGLLASPDDVFFLTLREARTALTGPDAPTGLGAPAGANAPAGSAPSAGIRTPGGSRPSAGPEALRALVAGRREEAARERRRRHVPRVLLSDGTEPEAVAGAAVAADGALTGTPASAGGVTGLARVVLDPVGAHLEPGEILVCPSTDPGWTPLFLTAGGLVMEMGGANSHGAVVAREYGIPAVVGVARATGRIVTGQEITVDGTSGTVTVSASPAAS